ncbi:glutamate-rich protein 3 [Austrofundulus limnaeus]|uniref:Glutamate-rich protein 3 n=1 Tax=Austrofundulus limnaeus TaxID=52670 RepID=A0A2I4CHK3_AUSLI|nr:PREDICTED: glutamate-rich protein 3-like [Austrofundulus limnaeus]
MIQSIASLIRAKSKLLLLENPDTVEIYKLPELVGSKRLGKGDVYLPVIPKRSSSLTSIPRSLSQSCQYLYDKRRGSFSSVTSQRTTGHVEKQNKLKAQKETKKSNVTVTMTYLGQSHRGSGLNSAQDELKVLQQINGGENLCVFKDLVTPGEQFRFVSQRHRGFPFSATFYINGLMAMRISSCCEYRYSPGFQQGRKSCFRLTWLAGGMPCYRCTSLRNKYSSCQQLNNGTKENLILPLEQNTGNDNIESSSPLFIPAKPEKKSTRRTRKHIKEGGSTDSEDHVEARLKETSKKKRRRGQINQKGSKGRTAGSNKGEDRRDGEGSERSAVTEKSEGRPEKKQQKHSKTANNVAAPQTEPHPSNKNQKTPISLQEEKVLTKQNIEKQKNLESDGKNREMEKTKDFYKECVEMSAELNKHWFKANILERCRLQKRLSSCPKDQASDVELSAESDTAPQPEEEAGTACQKPGEEESVEEQDLQAQLDAMMKVLKTSDEVEQLVLRNTGLTDDLLLSLAGVLKSSSSEVTLLNLNLNLIGPFGAHILLDVLRVKPLVQSLHLFGNKLRDHGVLTLLTGVAELQEQTAQAAVAIHQALLVPSEQAALQQLTPGWSSFRVFTLLELDIGGNGLSGDGVKVLASYMRSHSHLRYLGLAQTGGADLAAWKELFDSLKGNSSLAQIILDENNLGDPGVRLLADALKENASLQQVDLDRNDISDVGGNDLMGALLCRTQFPLRHLSLSENNISAGLMSRIQEEVKPAEEALTL